MTATVTENLHQPQMDGTAVRCAVPDCGTVVFGLLHPERVEVEREQENAREAFKRMHTSEYEPGRAPSISVEWALVASCSVCPDMGDVVMDDDVLVCQTCKTTWFRDGSFGERPEPEDDDEPGEDYYTAARDSQGGIRLSGGGGLLVANADHTQPEVLSWFHRSLPGHFREQYRAALGLMNREAGLPDERPVHPDEEAGRA